MNDCHISESQKLFVMSSFQFRFVVTVPNLLLVLVHALCFFAFAKTNRLPFLVKCFQSVWSVLRDDNNLIQLIGFDIVELLQTLGFALLSGSDDNYQWKLQCIYFRFHFHFQKYPQWNIIESLAELEVNVVGDKSAYAIFIFRFPVSRAGKKREFSLKGTLNTLNPAGFNWFTQNGWLTTSIRSRA